MSTIGSMNNMSSMAMMQGAQRRSDPAKMAADLFSKLDTTGQGYLEKTDFQSAFDSVSGSASSTSSVDALFTQLDGDSDGKVTQQEFSDTLTQLSAQLEQQFQSTRMQDAMSGGGMGGMGGMPPPPPPQNKDGFTQDELSSQLDEIGSTDSQSSTLISSIIENFEAADTNSDGKVSFQEAMTFDQSSQSSATANSTTSGTTANTSATAASAQASDGQVMLQIMRLMDAYGVGAENHAASNSLSVVA